MSDRVLLRKTPEEDELNRKRAELLAFETELAEQELHLTGLRVELSAFERRYLRIAGVRYAELDEIEAQIANRIAFNQPASEEAQNTAREARERATESGAEIHRQASQNAKDFAVSPTLKSLYREVAKRIHPDLAFDTADRARRQKLMAEANRAYEEGDEARLRAILDEYETSPESIHGEGTAPELVRVIRKIAQVNRRLKEIKAELKRLMRSELFEFKAKVEEAAKQGRDLLRELADDTEARIAEARSRLTRLAEG